jgi:hypothetical protein
MFHSLLKRKLLVLSCVGLFVLPIGAAQSWSYIDTYKQNVNMVGGVFGTYNPAFRDRAFNRVYHQYGYDWYVYYCHTDGVCNIGVNYGYVNPLYANGGVTNGKAICSNVDDNSNVTWTCQTTVP